MHIRYQSLLPQHSLSRFAGWMANCKKTWIKNRLIYGFIRHYNVDMSLAQEENPEHYINFNDFFTRSLKPEKRPISTDATDIISPVDGTISQMGDIKENQLIQAKKINYNLQALLGGSAKLAMQFQNGRFATFYLAPQDYHRVHIPYRGELKEMIYVPGRLFSVDTHTTKELPNLFVRNERVITLFSTPIGSMAVILVGAMLVGSISTPWEGIIAPASKRHIYHWHYLDNKISLAKGQELGQFQLGSTVIILFETNRMQWLTNLSEKKVIFGERIAQTI
ncbi:MAG: phosphatidylserine decarboxylase [Gammaproteobacteria bacterium]|nr:MAG: phosphatidylserine decarboxylase [Gammaproteobacteria bacterium]